jgi:membrane associated rhomboid family serine protease
MSTNNLRYEIAQSDILKIFIVTIVFSAVLIMAKVFFQMNGNTEAWFAGKVLPYMAISKLSLLRPYTIITHAITELNIGPLLPNFLWLYFFGFIIEDLKGAYSVIALYYTSALVVGIIVSIIAFAAPQLIGDGFYYGMRASIVAVATAAITFRPTYKVLQFINGGISVWVIGIIFLLLSIGFGGANNSINFIAIVLSMLIGYLSATKLSNAFAQLQHKLSIWANKNWKANNTTKAYKPTINTNANIKVVDVSEQKMNNLLDKIKEKGIDSLTAEEKQWLNAYSNK